MPKPVSSVRFAQTHTLANLQSLVTAAGRLRMQDYLLFLIFFCLQTRSFVFVTAPHFLHLYRPGLGLDSDLPFRHPIAISSPAAGQRIHITAPPPHGGETPTWVLMVIVPPEVAASDPERVHAAPLPNDTAEPLFVP